MSGSMIASVAISVAVILVIVFAGLGALGWGASPVVQALAAAGSGGLGVAIGSAVHRRFFERAEGS
jgi:hypothetical protein